MCNSVLNLRPVGGVLLSNTVASTNSFQQANFLKLNVYRSGRPDNISADDIDVLRSKLGIRAYIDLRTELEYVHENGPKLLDKQCVAPRWLDEKTMDKNKSHEVIWTEERFQRLGSGNEIKHYMIGAFGSTFFKNMFEKSCISWIQKVWLYLYLFLYYVFGTGHFSRYFQRLLAESGLLKMYKMIIDCSGINIRSALQLMSQPENLPCIVCCHAGKDRTGIISALVLAVCGYDKDKIADDYALSEIALPFDHPEHGHLQGSLRPAPREVMLELLAYVEEMYGSVAAYLETIGFSLDDQERLRSRVTSQPAP